MISMESIIHQLAQELGEKILKRAIYEEKDLDTLCSEVSSDCKNTAKQMIQCILSEWNEQIRKDKVGRKELGLVLQQKERPRAQVTALGHLEWNRDYYYDKTRDTYVSPLDEILNVSKYERITRNVSAGLINYATSMSYAKSAEMVTDCAISRQSVRNCLLRLDVPEVDMPQQKKVVKELHIYADEDHAHLQREHKEKGKRGQIIPLVTVTEGTKSVSNSRNATVNPVRFVNEKFSSKELWKTVEGYIDSAYEINEIEKIWVHGDGGGWIRNGLENYPQTLHVMDGYHFYKELRKLCKEFPTRNLRVTITNCLKDNNRNKVYAVIGELIQDSQLDDVAKIVETFGIYLMGHWEEIRRLVIEDIPGSCTEGQVSHVLSERFSRDPIGWSKAALGKLTSARVSVMNGRLICGDDIKSINQSTTYADYAEQVIQRNCKGAIDWSIFEKTPEIFDVCANTQFIIRSLGCERNTLN